MFQFRFNVPSWVDLRYILKIVAKESVHFSHTKNALFFSEIQGFGARRKTGLKIVISSCNLIKIDLLFERQREREREREKKRERERKREKSIL